MTDGAGNRQQIVYSDYYTNKPGGVGQTHVSPYTTADPTGFRAGSQWDYYTGLPVKTFNLLPGGSTELQVVTTSYDFADRPLQTNRPDGGWVKTAYWDNWVATVTSQLVDTGKTRYKFEQYDGAGRAYRKASDHPDGVTGKYAGQIVVFNKLGQVEDSSNVAAINGSWTPGYEDASTGFVFTHLTRDELDRLKIVTFADNNTRQYAYDGCGCAGGSETRSMDELGQETVTKTDFLGRLIEAVEPPPGNPQGVYSKAVYIYDELDRLREIRHSDAGGVKTQYRYFNYDGYGRLQSENTPEGGVVTYGYKPNDLVETAANQRNITVTYSYNTRNLVNNISYSDGTPTVTYGYDQYGARELTTDGEGTTSYSYNSFRQLQTETRTFTGVANRSYKLSYTYNLADGVEQANYRIEQVTPFSTLYDKNVNYAYNTVGGLSGVGTNLIGSDPNASTNVLNSVTYRGSGALRSVIYGNNRQMAMGYDPNRQQTTSMKVDRVGNPADKIVDYVYNYYDANGKNNGRIRKIFDNTDTAYTTTYVYDDYRRLQSATASAYSRSYQYNAWGNITNFAGVTLSYQLNGSGAPATNRLSSDSQGINYSYDQAGNMTQAGSATYSYDGANRLKTAGGGTSTYGYDGDGKRVRVTDGGAAVFYVYSSQLGQVAMEVNTSGVRRAYVYVGGKQVAQQSVDGQFYWLHTNHLGSSRAMTDVNGNLVYKGQFDPYGQALLEWGSVSLNTKKFTGYERDGATGLDYAGARMYNPGRGRFMMSDPLGCAYQGKNPDPLGAAKKDKPQMLNRYSYVMNDPINLVDPEGLSGVCPAEFQNCEGGDMIISVGGGGGGGIRSGGGDEQKCYQDCVRSIDLACKSAGDAAGIACLVAAGVGAAAIVVACAFGGTPIAGFICAVILAPAVGAGCAWVANSTEASCRENAKFQCRNTCKYWGP
jgi:RHS repeat-associated protein